MRFSNPHLWRQMVRHWRLYALVLLLLVMATALLGSIPMLARQLAEEGLQGSLQAMTVSGRNLLLQGDFLTPAIEERLGIELGDVFTEKFEMRDVKMLAEATIFRPTGPEPIDNSLLDFLNLHLHSFVGLADHVRVVDGRLPHPPATDEEIASDGSALEIEAAVGQAAAQFLDLRVGDVLRTIDGAYLFTIVGIIEPTNPDDERWWGDRQLLPFNYWRRIAFGPPDFVEVTSGLLLHPDRMAQITPHTLSWRVLLDTSHIHAENAEAAARTIRSLEATLTSSNVSLDTALINTLDQFIADVETGQLSLLLLISQSLLAVLYTLAMVGTAVLEQTTAEIATLSARGFSAGHITRQMGVRYGVLALLALPLGMGTAVRLSQQPSIPLLSWQLGLAAMLVAWLVLVMPVSGLVRRGLVSNLQQQNRPETRQSWRQQLVFDGAVLGLGALSYWQLRQFSSRALVAGETITVDPLLLLAPTLLMIGFALVLRHITPLLIRLAARLSARSSSFMWPMGLAWLGRDHGRSGRIIFLISVALGLALFAAIFTHSLTMRQDEMALYRSGAAIRLEVVGGDLPTVTAALQADEAVAAGATLFRGKTVPVDTTVQIDLLALNPEAATIVAPYPTGMSMVNTVAVLAELDTPALDAVPVLLSRRNVIPGTGVGDRFTIQMGSAYVPVVVRGLLDEFATMNAPFVLANLDSLRPFLISQGQHITLSGRYEVWLSLAQPVTAADLLQRTGLTDGRAELLSESASLRAQYGRHLLSRQILGVFRLNVLVLALLSFASLFLLQVLEGWRRRPSWGVLVSIGLPEGGIRRMMATEGVALVGVGTAVGCGLGWLLAQITLPLLMVTLNASMGGSTEAPLLLNWLALGLLLLVMVMLYLLAVLVAAWLNGRVEIARLLRWGM